MNLLRLNEMSDEEFRLVINISKYILNDTLCVVDEMESCLYIYNDGVLQCQVSCIPDIEDLDIMRYLYMANILNPLYGIISTNYDTFENEFYKALNK